MDTSPFNVVYDVAQEGVWVYALEQSWMWFAGGVAGLAFLVHFIRKRQYGNIVFILLWLTLWFGIGGLGFGNVTVQRYRCVEWLNSGEYETVEGPVTNFKPMPYTGHSMESFTVGGQQFLYSDYDLSKGSFSNTESHGGPVHAGLYVRIACHDGRILRLEVRR